MHRDLQHHQTLKATRTAPMTRLSKRQPVGRFNQLELRLIESLKLRLHCRVKKLPDRPAKTTESDLEISDSENKSDVEPN